MSSKYIDGTRVVYWDNSNGNLTIPGTIFAEGISSIITANIIPSTIPVSSITYQSESVIIGKDAAGGASTISIGSFAGNSLQGTYAIAIGAGAGKVSQGSNAIALGTNAGEISQVANSIVFNASNVALNPITSGLYAQPIRDDSNIFGGFLHYNSTTKEIVYNEIGGDSGSLLSSFYIGAIASANLTTSSFSLFYSPNSSNWTQPNAGFFNGGALAVKRFNNIYYAVGYQTNTNTCLLYSYDGIQWFPPASIPIDNGAGGSLIDYAYNITYTNNMYHIIGQCVGDSGFILYSYDGQHWFNIPQNNVWIGDSNQTHSGYDITYGNKIWVAVGVSSDPEFNLYYSYDGINWILNSTSYKAVSVDYDSNKFIALAHSNTVYTLIQSLDGIAWTEFGFSGLWSNASIVPFSFGSIKWNGSLWVANIPTPLTTGSAIRYSSNGFDWSQATGTLTSGYNYTKLYYDGNKWTVGLLNSTIAYQESGDGINWKNGNNIPEINTSNVLGFVQLFAQSSENRLNNNVSFSKSTVFEHIDVKHLAVSTVSIRDDNMQIDSIVRIESDGRIALGGTALQSNTVLTAKNTNPFAHVGVGIYNEIGYGGGVLDLNFNPIIDGNIQVIVRQSDDKFLIGGTFFSVDGANKNYIARFLTNGALDNTFNPSELDGTIYAIALQTDGKIIIGGEFNSVIRLNPNGTIDESLVVNDNVNSIAIVGTDIYIGGAFTFPTSYIMRLNSDSNLQQPDAAFNPVLNAPVNTILIENNGNIVLGGAFTSPSQYLVRYNSAGTVVTNFASNFNGPVEVLLLQSDNKIVVGGQFTSPGSYIARLNAGISYSVDTTFTSNVGSRFTNIVYALALHTNNKILVGGAGASNTLTRLNSDGTLDSSFNVSPNTTVNSIVVLNDNSIILGGEFTSVNGRNRDFIARLYPDNAYGGSLELGKCDSNVFQPMAQIIGAPTFYDSSSEGQLDFLTRRGDVLQSGMTITNTGNVGIGLSNPGAKLDVNGDLQVNNNIVSQSTILLANRLRFNFTSNDNTSYIQTGDGTGTTGSAGNLFIGNWLQTPDASSRKIMFAANGNVGIGTTTPGELLDVRGNLRVGGNNIASYIAFHGTFGDGSGNFNNTYIGERIFSEPESSELLLFKGNDHGVSGDRIRLFAGEHRFDTFTTSTGNNSFSNIGASPNAINRMIITSAGNVGIGTTTPQARLHLDSGGMRLTSALSNSSTRPVISPTLIAGEIRGTSVTGSGLNDGFLRLSAGGGTSANDQSGIDITGSATTLPDMDRNIRFYTAGTERMRIDSNGNIGIGRTNPDSNYRIDMNGAYRAITSLEVRPVQNVNTYMYAQALTTGPERIRIGGSNATTGIPLTLNEISGNVGIGTPTPQAKLDVNGTMNINGNTTINNGTMNINGTTTINNGNLLLGNRLRITSPGDGITYIQAGDGTGTAGSAGDLFIGNWLQGAGASSRKIMFTSNGNVGIGTSAPISKLHVDGRAYQSLHNYSSVSGYYALDKDKQPIVSEAYATKAVSTWTTRTSAANNNWYSVVWSPELRIFVAVATSGTDDRIMTSPDGINWTTRNSVLNHGWTDVTWAAECPNGIGGFGLFVAVAESGTGNRVITSPDGINWTARTSAADTNNWHSVCWSPELGIFVAVAYSGDGNRVMTSPNGINWTIRTSAANNDWRSVVWSPELRLFVAVASLGSNRVMISPDGITWTIRNSATNDFWRSVVWSPQLGIFVAVAGSSVTNSGAVMTSSDGNLWTSRPIILNNAWLSVTWSPELGIFVAVAAFNSINRVMTSPDGINWTIQTSAAANSWRSVCWSPELGIFVAVASSGSNRVMTSALKGRIPTSYNVFDNEFNSISETGSWSFSQQLNASSFNASTIISEELFANMLTISSLNISSLNASDRLLISQADISSLFVSSVVSGSQTIEELDVDTAYISSLFAYEADIRSLFVSSVASGSQTIQDLNVNTASIISLDVSSVYVFDALTVPQIEASSIVMSSFTTIHGNMDVANISSLNVSSITAVTFIYLSSINEAEYISSVNVDAQEITTSSLYAEYIDSDIVSISSIFVSSLVSGSQTINDLTVDTASITSFLGIGTTTPSERLTVDGKTLIFPPDDTIAKTNLGAITIQGPARQLGNNTAQVGLGHSICFRAETNPRYSENIIETVAAIRAEYDIGSVDTLSGSHAITFHNFLGWGSGGAGTLSEKMRINSRGNVGIGTSTPISKLHVDGRTYQSIQNYSSLSGYYALDKDKQPIVSEAYATKAVSTWTSRRSAADNAWFSVTWSPELRIFVAVAANTEGSENQVMTTPDGINWTARTSPAGSWQSIVWSPELGIFVAVGNSGVVMTSPDGINWTAGQNIPIDQWISVVWSPELHIFVAVTSNSGSANHVMTSSNGTEWIIRTSIPPNQWRSVCWSPELGIFVAVGSSIANRQVITSSNGIDWISRNVQTSNFWRSVVWSPQLGIFVAVASSGSNPVMTSSDGNLWTSHPNIPTDEWLSVTWSPELGIFVAVAAFNSINRVMTSPDGINWTIRTSAAAISWRSVVWSPELGIFVAVASSGSNNRVMTSALKGRIPTSYNVFDNEFNSISETGSWNFNRIAVGGTELQSNDVLTAKNTNPFAHVGVGIYNELGYGGGVLDLNFNPIVNGNIHVIVRQSDDKFLIGGTFVSVDGANKNYIARFLNNGALDTTFNPSVLNGTIYAIALQTDGKIIIGGEFNSVIRLNTNGTIDVSLVVNGNVNSIAIVGTDIYVGGAFTTPTSYIMRLNSNSNLQQHDTAFAPILNAPVNTILIENNGNIVLGGAFTSPSQYLVRYNSVGTVVTNFASNFNGPVEVLLLQSDNKIVVGGQFTSPGSYIVRLNAIV